jgi:hypothetical protein
MTHPRHDAARRPRPLSSEDRTLLHGERDGVAARVVACATVGVQVNSLYGILRVRPDRPLRLASACCKIGDGAGARSSGQNAPRGGLGTPHRAGPVWMGATALFWWLSETEGDTPMDTRTLVIALAALIAILVIVMYGMSGTTPKSPAPTPPPATAPAPPPATAPAPKTP